MLKKIFFQNIILLFVLQSVAQSAESGGMPQLNPEFWISQIFWLMLSFFTLFILLSKFILPKISNNLEKRKSQILENIDIAEKQRIESEKKIKEFEKIIINSKNEAKNYYNSAKEKVIGEVNKKKETLDIEIDNEIKLVEKEIKDLKSNSQEKIKKIAIETSSNLVKQIVGFDVNNSSISAIVEEVSKKR